MKKILISDSVNQKSVDILKSAGHSVTYKTDFTEEELKKNIAEFNALVVRSSTKVNADLISSMQNMEVIGRAGSGVDNIDVIAASKKGILVMNTPGGNTISTAEHTFAMILALCRHIPQANQSMQAGKWERKKFSGTELRGKILAVIGLGKIGKEIVKRANAFGMNVIGFDPLLPDSAGNELGIKLVKLDQIWPTADIITVHVPLNDATKDLIDKKTLDKCKDGVKIINCARGGIVNEQDLINAMDSGKVSGAAFDVFITEPPDNSNKLLTHPKVICTPHLGASTEEAQEIVAIQIAEQINDYFKSSKISGAVNLTGFTDGLPIEIKSYTELSERLGKFSAQLLNNRLKKISIQLNGEYLHKYSKEISISFMKGFLSIKLNEPVNYINAPLFFKEMKIFFEEKLQASHSVFNNLITIEIESEEKLNKISGAVFGNNELRVVQIDDYLLEVKPEGSLILYRNIDKPGMLAAVGKILAEKNINIAGLSLGRIHAGQDALTVINVDNTIQESVLEPIKSMDGVHGVFSVHI